MSRGSSGIEWSEITIGNREENLNLLYNSVIQGKNLDLLGKTCKLFLKKKPKSPMTSALLKLAVQNQDKLNEEEKTEVWSEVLEKFSPGIAYYLGKRYLPSEWREDFFESLFLQNGRIPYHTKRNPDKKGIPASVSVSGLPEWMIRNPFGIAKFIHENPKEARPVLELLRERLPESYPAHTVLFVDAFLERDVVRFSHHYHHAGRIKFHPQSLYMKALIDIRMGEDDTGARMIELIRENTPGWEIPAFLQGGKRATLS